MIFKHQKGNKSKERKIIFKYLTSKSHSKNISLTNKGGKIVGTIHNIQFLLYLDIGICTKFAYIAT